MISLRSGHLPDWAEYRTQSHSYSLGLIGPVLSSVNLVNLSHLGNWIVAANNCMYNSRARTCAWGDTRPMLPRIAHILDISCCPFMPLVSSFKYLGILLPLKLLSSLYEVVNLIPLLYGKGFWAYYGVDLVIWGVLTCSITRDCLLKELLPLRLRYGHFNFISAQLQKEKFYALSIPLQRVLPHPSINQDEMCDYCFIAHVHGVIKSSVLHPWEGMCRLKLH